MLHRLQHQNSDTAVLSERPITVTSPGSTLLTPASCAALVRYLDRMYEQGGARETDLCVQIHSNELIDLLHHTVTGTATAGDVASLSAGSGSKKGGENGSSQSRDYANLLDFF